MLKRYWFYIVLLSTLVLQAQAQTTYPIQVNANLLPPYSAYLSDYYSGTREKLTLTLINRDQFKPTLNVRLRMIITAPGGLRLQTNEQAFIEPIIVENGSPVRLTQDDIAPYFQPQNLITQGYMTSGKFPEGMVEFCFQAVEAYTGQALSLSTCTRAWITSQKPPLLSLPRNNESIVFREPLNVLFQWTPLHQGLAQVEYEFILKELWDNGMTPQAAFPYAPEIYRETTRSTSLVYGAMQPPLLAGKRYAWCIRAQARDGMETVNLFQNDGYSEIRWFTLQDNCAPPEFVMATAEKKRLNVEWTALPDHIGFSVSYRVIKARSSDGKVDASEWKEQQSQEPKVILYGLQSGGTYEYRVASYCMAGSPVYSPIFSITLPETDSARLAQCGIMPDVNLTNKEPIKELKTGEIIMANDYPVTVTKISGANGIYTGEGWTIVPWLNDAKIAVQFTSITVNTDKQMINGYIDAKYDKNEGQIANLDDVFEGGFDVGTVKTGITKIDHVLDFSIPGVEAFSLNDEGDLVITDSEGEPHTISPANTEGQGNEGNKVVVFPMTVQDKDGNVYQVEKVTETDATGKEVEKVKATYIGKAGTPLAEGSFDPSQLNGDKAIVTFAKGDGIYGFDTWLDYYDNVSLIEDKYQKLYTGYYAPWKLVPVGKTDKVIATIEIKDKSIKPEQVIFKTPKGTEYKATYSNGTYTMQLAAGPAGDVQELYALYPNGKDKYYTLGKLNIVSYELQKYTVVLVPVNNVPVDKQAVQKTLQDIYGPVGVTWDVIVDANFDYTGNYRLMEKSTGLSTYNEDMRALNNAYKSARADKFDKAANYLFFLKATGSEDINDRDATGFMPRGSQFGYIFTSEIKDVNEPITVAHELGHGRWKLFHTFDDHYGGYKKGETENVMDYNNGLHVAKWQWDIMHDPAMLVSIFEEDDDSAYKSWTSLEGDVIGNIPGYENVSKSFLSLTGDIITLPADARDFTFFNGYLVKFTIGDERYISLSLTASKIFKGYYFDAIKNGPSGYTIGKSTPYVGKVENMSEKPAIFYAIKNGEGCGVFKVFKAKYKGLVAATSNGGVNKSVEFYLQNDIKTLSTALENHEEIGEVHEQINCLEGRSKELFKFVVDHYESHEVAISEEYKGNLIKALAAFNQVFIKDLDGEYSGNHVQVKSIKIREMLNYGHIEFLANLQDMVTSLLEEDKTATRALIVEFEDYNTIRDVYIIYNITKQLDPDCTIAEHLQEEIDKQLKEKGEVEFNLDFFIAAAKTWYEIPVNESFELISCILKNIKAPESLYNPNRLDYKLKGLYETLFQEYMGMDSESLTGTIPAEVSSHAFACGCGAWNSIVDLVLGLSDLGAGVTQNPADLLRKLKEFGSAVTRDGGMSDMGSGVWTLLKEHHGYANGYGFDSYQVAYGVCYDGVFVASFFIGVGELKMLSEAGKLGDFSEMARIVVRAAKAYPKNVVVTFAQLAEATAKLSSSAARKVVLQIVEKLPGKVVAQLPSNVKGIILATALNEGIVRFSDEGLHILAQMSSQVDHTKNIIYQSEEVFTDLNKGTTGKLTFVDEGNGKITAYLDKTKITNVADDVLAEINRIKELRKTDEPARLQELGYDLDRKKFIPREAEVAYNIEEQWGYLKRYKAPEGSGTKGDWIGISGKGEKKTFDHFGLKDDPKVISNNADIPKQRAKFFESLDEHFEKADYVVLDIEYVKKYNQKFHQDIMDYINQKYGSTKLIEYK